MLVKPWGIHTMFAYPVEIIGSQKWGKKPGNCKECIKAEERLSFNVSAMS
jgi:hypothetical protein